MITVAGRPAPGGGPTTRREWLRAGGLGTLGLSLADVLNARAIGETSPATALPGFGRARSCIVLFMFGAPAHQDVWDLKPDAPAEVRGEFRPIASSVPGLSVGEHIPRLAAMADRYALIRSVTHPDNTHTVAMHYMLTGVRHARPETNPRNAPDDFPCFGAVVDYLASGAVDGFGPRRSVLPASVSLNAPANQVSANNHIFPGFFAGQIGSRFDPMFVPQNADAAGFQALPPVAGVERLGDRRKLLESLDAQVRYLEQAAAVRGMDAHRPGQLA
ncbi:MAG: DUF1501 domain-containing protein [Isosphaeraceae bacterium]